MTWDDWLDLIATILVVWGVLAVLAGILIGKFCKAGRGPASNEGQGDGRGAVPLPRD